MMMDRQQIENLLENRGDPAAARRAQRELPPMFDTREYLDVLTRLGLDAEALTAPGGEVADVAHP
jgi:hypothetical protein